jgi:hypothetical protein
MTDFIAMLDSVIRNGRNCTLLMPCCRRRLTSCSAAPPESRPGHARHHRRWISHRAAVVLYPPRLVPLAHARTLDFILETWDAPTDSPQYVQDCEHSQQVLPALYLLGLLTNYNKFEFQNPYRLRLDDFVNDAIIQDMITCFGHTCQKVRDAYIAVQDDMPEGWTLGSTLGYFGLGVLTPGARSRPSTPTPAPEEVKSLFTAL